MTANDVRPGGVKMHANEEIGPARPEAALLKASANVYDFAARRTDSHMHIKALEHENALLTRMVSEVGIEIVRLRKALAAQ
jgi:hypothetical protein